MLKKLRKDCNGVCRTRKFPNIGFPNEKVRSEALAGPCHLGLYADCVMGDGFRDTEGMEMPQEDKRDFHVSRKIIIIQIGPLNALQNCVRRGADFDVGSHDLIPMCSSVFCMLIAPRVWSWISCKK